MTEYRRILVVDDHPLCATAVNAAISALNVAAKVQTAASLRELATIAHGPDVALILLDLRLPDSTGLNGIATAKAAFPGVPICMLSGQADVGTMRQAIAQDIAGFLPKTLAFDALCKAISDLLAGKKVFPPLHGSAQDRGTVLSTAETRIMQLLSLGLQNKRIAFELGLAESTVKSHLARIFQKLQVTNRSQAILAYEKLNSH